jgi:hypothetical protein
MPGSRPDRPRAAEAADRRRLRERRRRIAAATGCGPLFKIAWGAVVTISTMGGWLVHYCQPPGAAGHFFDGLQLLVPHPDPAAGDADAGRGL